MSDEEALLAAIAAHPDEDTPRLVYADWLDENDRPIRAEFIRVQIEISRKELLPRSEQDQHVALWKRNQELLDNHRAEILGNFGWLSDWKGLEFRRGFLAEIRAEVEEFESHWRAFAGLKPLPRLVVVGAPFAVRLFLGFDVSFSALGAPDLSSQERQASIVSAIKGVAHLGEDVSYPERLTYPRIWQRLSELDLSGLRLGDDNAVALLQADSFPVLADLDLSGNDLTDAAIMPLVRSGLPRQLKRLILGGNPLSDAGVRLLAEQWPTGSDDRLEYLNLRYTNIGPPGQQALLARFGGRIDLF